MKLDSELAKEIKKANGDGSREAKFKLFHEVEDAADIMGDYDITSRVPSRVNETIRRCGRVPTALAIAATLYCRKERIDYWGLDWALEVLKLWTNKSASFVERVQIDDTDYHPTKICADAESFVRLTTEE